VSAALGTHALGSANCPAAGLQVNIEYEQAPLAVYERSFGSLTMRLFAAVYLTMSLSTLLAGAVHAVVSDRESQQRATMEAAGLAPAAYWVVGAATPTHFTSP
jgi:hypothetical protein